MAVDVAVLRTLLVADTANYSRGLSKADAQAGRFERNASRSFTKVGAAAKAAGKVAGVALAAGLAVGFKKSIVEAREAAKVNRDTAAAIKSTGGAANVSAKQIQRMANAISVKAGKDDEAIQSAQTLLLTFTKIRNEVGKGNQVFSRASMIVADFSARFHKDLNSSAIMVGKALNDPIKGITALGKAGVQFTTQQKDQIKTLVESGKTLQAQKMIMAELETQTKGAAVANADPFDQFKVSVDNLAESFGTALLPSFSAAAAAASQFISEIETGTGTGGRFAANMTTAYNAVRTFAGTTYNAVRAITQSNTAMAALGAIVGGLAGRFVAIGIAAVVARFASLAASIRAAGGAMNFLTAAITRNPLGAIAVAVGAVAGAFGVLSIRQRQVAVDADQVTAAFQRQRTAMQAVRDFSLDLKNVTLAYSQANLQVKSAVQQRTLAEQQFGQGSLQWQQANLQVKQAVNERTRAQRHLNDTEREGSSRSRELTEATRSNIQTSRDRAQTVLDELAALQKQAATEGKTPARLAAIRDKQKQLSGAIRDYRDATGSARSANRLMQRSIANLGGDWSAFASFFADNVNDTLRKLGAKPLSFSRSNFNIATRISPRGDIDTVVSKPKASGGFLGGSGLRDTVPIMAAPGEAIVNRHQQRPIEHALRQTFGFGLNDLFRKESRPHYMARGGTATAVPQAGANKMAAAAKRYIGNISAAMSGGATSTTGLVPQVRRALAFARKHGWPGTVSSGFRSREQQARLFNLFKQGRGNLAAPPGSSSHELGQAVDVTAAEAFARAMGIAPANAKLMRLVPGEPWHFSVSGHAKGGFVKGKVSTFGPPLEAAGTTASGVSSALPGIALYNRSTLGKWFNVSLGGRRAKLKQTDIGPHPRTGRAIDITGAGARKLGINPRKFPTDSIASAAIVSTRKNMSGKGKGKGKGRGRSSGSAPRSVADMQSAAREGLGRSIELANLRDQIGAVGGSDIDQARIGVSAAERGLSMAREFRDPVEIAQAELALAQARRTLSDAQAAPDNSQAMIDAINANTEEMRKTRELADRTHGINVGEVNRMFMDWISGQLGGRGAASLRTLSRGAQYA